MLSRPPGPHGPIVVGNLIEYLQRPLEFIPECTQRYGDVAYFKIGPFRHFYLVSNPDLIHQVLVQEPEKYGKTPTTRNVLGKGLGTGLLTANGDTHRRQRVLTTPAFHTKRVMDYAKTMVSYTQRMLANWKDGETRDLARDMQGLTLEIVAKTLFGSEIVEIARDVGASLLVMQKIARTQLALPVIIPMSIPTPGNIVMGRECKKVDKVVFDLIAQRRASNEDRGDLFSMLLSAEDESGGKLSDREVRDQVITLFSAGKETTADTLNWTLHMIATHPKVAEKVHENVDNVLQGRAATFEDLKKLSYLEQVIKETLRLYPAAWAFTREPNQDVRIGGYAVPKGSYVLISPYGLHRDPRFFPQPLTFDPGRFSDARKDELHKRAYIPFSRGPRVCIGMSFAMMEITLVVATIMQQCRLERTTLEPIAAEPMMTLTPRGGLPLRVRRRSVPELRTAGLA